ncbi:aldolase [Obba rivulosa]|uniref:Aldolase n=1 Tax=Obba rivulosa TaxID=1052685 RepID=A0A8E2DUN0_9APHY|nr:aldolase [Obba rivulosa]
MSNANLLSYVRSQLTVDVDSMDPAVAARHTAGSEKFCDMTSNQAIVYNEASRPERAQLLAVACEAAQSSGLSAGELVVHAVDVLTVLLAKEVFPFLTGRVHAQTSPSHAYDTEATIGHAKRLVALFEAHGIPKSNVCIKIPATPESMVACQYLEKIGIRTLATCLFSVSQALAASQAGCLYVAPYFNELRVHFDPKLWREYNDTAKQHPMSAVIRAIVRIFKTIDSKTLVMPASIVTSTEVAALVTLEPDHLTLSGGVLDQLASSPTPQCNPKSHHADIPLEAPPAQAPEAHGAAIHETDLLANGANALREALIIDTETARKLADALQIFDEMEQKTFNLIRQQLSI